MSGGFISFRDQTPQTRQMLGEVVLPTFAMSNGYGGAKNQVQKTRF